MTTGHDEGPIACTLAPGAFKDRVAWIQELNRDALLSNDRRDLMLELQYTISAADRVDELVRREQDCCGFLTFDVERTSDEVVLRIRAPESARLAADLLFEQFVSETGETLPETAARSLGDRSPVRFATIATTGAILCGVCCVLPFALPAVVVATTGTALAWIGRAHAWVTALAVIATGVAWIWVKRSGRKGASHTPSTFYAMTAVTALLIVALVWPRIEPALIRAIR